MPSIAGAQSNDDKPGLQPYTPTRIEWLALTLNDALQRELNLHSQYSMSIIAADHETLLIFVRYLPDVDRELMNMAIENAKEVIMIHAKSYGWGKWVKTKERVEMVKLKSEGKMK